MKSFFVVLIVLSVLLLASCTQKTKEPAFSRKPVDEMFAQRAYPHGDIPFEV